MSDDVLDGVQVRAATVQNVDTEKGLVDVKIVPYEVEVELDDGLFEVFTRGAFAAAVGNPSRCKMSNQQHDRMSYLGVATELRDEPDGHYGTVFIPPTERGTELLTLMRAGVLDEISVEFRTQKRHLRVDRRSDGLHVRHDKATLIGLSPVAEGAYGRDARVLSVREARVSVERERELALLASLTSGGNGVS